MGGGTAGRRGMRGSIEERRSDIWVVFAERTVYFWTQKFIFGVIMRRHCFKSCDVYFSSKPLSPFSSRMAPERQGARCLANHVQGEIAPS